MQSIHLVNSDLILYHSMPTMVMNAFIYHVPKQLAQMNPAPRPQIMACDQITMTMPALKYFVLLIFLKS